MLLDSVYLVAALLAVGLAALTRPRPACRPCPVCRRPASAPAQGFCAGCEAQYQAAYAADQGGRYIAAMAKAHDLDLAGAALQRYIGLALAYSATAPRRTPAPSGKGEVP